MPFWDDSPNPNHDSRLREHRLRSWWNLPSHGIHGIHFYQQDLWSIPKLILYRWVGVKKGFNPWLKPLLMVKSVKSCLHRSTNIKTGQNHGICSLLDDIFMASNSQSCAVFKTVWLMTNHGYLCLIKKILQSLADRQQDQVVSDS